MNPNALKKLQENPVLVAAYSQAMSLLNESGVLDILRDNGRVGPVSPETPHYVEYQNALANWSLGYNTCMDQLLYFREIFLEKDSYKDKMQMDFGSLDSAVEKGDLTQGEADAIRNGK